ncbi:MAG: hypothetical protein UF067_03500 [Paludibacteraceae bacterium]|nr:hypothetical protein [Paludibacteraceae bacterium]
MYQLNFPNGNVQTYEDLYDLKEAAKLFGGKAEYINSNTYAFVPKE